MNIAAWILSFLLAVPLTVIGMAKIIDQHHMAATRIHLGISPNGYRMIGLAEIAGAIGLLIGAVAGGSADWIGYLAALGLIAVTAGAVFFHRKVGDSINEMIPAIVLGLLCLSYIITLTARPFEESSRLPTVAASAILAS